MARTRALTQLIDARVKDRDVESESRFERSASSGQA
jgi:hypothetical protein